MIEDKLYGQLQNMLAHFVQVRQDTDVVPKLKRDELMYCGWAICEQYQRDHRMDLTLRQLYYALVSKGVLSNGQKHYSRLGDTLSKARVAGVFPMDYIVDRGRTVGGTSQYEQIDLDDALRGAASELRMAPFRWLHSARWNDQAIWPSVWVEKEALAGVFAPTCNDLGVGMFACKGYPSVSALFDWLKKACAAVEAGAERCVVLYCGDHDPDGLEIPRSCERTLAKMLGNGLLPEYQREMDSYVEGVWAPEDRGVTEVPIEFKRIALTTDQIELYDPPPFPAKQASSRFDRYVADTGLTDAWELDALTPTVLRDLIQDEVEELFDADVYDANRVIVDEQRQAMRRKMNAEWVTKAAK